MKHNPFMNIKKKVENIKEIITTGDGKSKTLIKNIALSFGVKGFAIIISLINMPVFMDYFHDTAILGIWFTLISMLNWILTFDLGIGNGLRNYLVIALEKKDTAECRKLIASAYCSVGLIVILLSVIAFFAIPRVNWNNVCNIEETEISLDILSTVIRMLIIGVLFQFLLKLITSILYAMQKPAIPNFLLLVSNILLLLATFILNTGDTQTNLIRLSIAYVATANIPMLVTTIIVFIRPLKEIGIHPSYWSVVQTKQIIVLGISFLALQLLSMASFNTREFYIMRFLSPEDVVPYQVYNRLFSLVSTFFVLAMTPMWSAITQALAQTDYAWIRKIYKNVAKLFLLFSIGSVSVILLSQQIVNVWLGSRSIEMNYQFGITFAVFNVEYMWINFHSQIENGLKRLNAQKLGYVIASLALPLFAYLMSRISNEWIVVVIANIIALLPICFLQYMNMRNFLNKQILEMEEL